MPHRANASTPLGGVPPKTLSVHTLNPLDAVTGHLDAYKGLSLSAYCGDHQTVLLIRPCDFARLVAVADAVLHDGAAEALSERRADDSLHLATRTP